MKKYRFIERDFFYSKILNSSEYITPEVVEEILDKMQTYWCDYTFKFHSSGTCEVYCNNSEAKISLGDLEGAAYDFYVRKRIETIKTLLLQTA